MEEEVEVEAEERRKSGEESRGIEVVVGGELECKDLETMRDHFFFSESSSSSWRLSSGFLNQRRWGGGSQLSQGGREKEEREGRTDLRVGLGICAPFWL